MTIDEAREILAALVSEGVEFVLNILTRLGEAFRYEDLLAGSEVILLGDVPVRVATPRMLYRMKGDTVRPQDRADAARIRAAFDLEGD
jgi:hypothetical protein